MSGVFPSFLGLILHRSASSVQGTCLNASPHRCHGAQHQADSFLLFCLTYGQGSCYYRTVKGRSHGCVQGQRWEGGIFATVGKGQKERLRLGADLLESVSSLHSCKLIWSVCSCTPIQPLPALSPTVRLQPWLLLHPLSLSQQGRGLSNPPGQTLTPSSSSQTSTAENLTWEHVMRRAAVTSRVLPANLLTSDVQPSVIENLLGQLWWRKKKTNKQKLIILDSSSHMQIAQVCKHNLLIVYRGGWTSFSLAADCEAPC